MWLSLVRGGGGDASQSKARDLDCGREGGVIGGDAQAEVALLTRIESRGDDRVGDRAPHKGHVFAHWRQKGGEWHSGFQVIRGSRKVGQRMWTNASQRSSHWIQSISTKPKTRNEGSGASLRQSLKSQRMKRQ